MTEFQGVITNLRVGDKHVQITLDREEEQAQLMQGNYSYESLLQVLLYAADKRYLVKLTTNQGMVDAIEIEYYLSKPRPVESLATEKT